MLNSVSKIKKRVVMELVYMNSLGLFDLNILSVQVGSTLYDKHL